MKMNNRMKRLYAELESRVMIDTVGSAVQKPLQPDY